jgi:hypothetical protein
VQAVSVSGVCHSTGARDVRHDMVSARALLGAPAPESAARSRRQFPPDPGNIVVDVRCLRAAAQPGAAGALRKRRARTGAEAAQVGAARCLGGMDGRRPHGSPVTGDIQIVTRDCGCPGPGRPSRSGPATIWQ